MADPYRFDPLQFAVDQAEQGGRATPPKPGGWGLGAVAEALWRSLPQNVRGVYGSVPSAVAELSPGAGVRDMVQASGDLSQNVMAGNPLAAAGSLAGIGLGAMGVIPGARAPAAVAREASGVGRVAQALADAPTMQAYHGSPVAGLAELTPGKSGPFGPATYLSPNSGVAGRYGANLYTADIQPAQLFQGLGSRYLPSNISSYDVWAEQAARLGAAAGDQGAALEKVVAKLWPEDGYGAFHRLWEITGSKEAAQALLQRAGFRGISGHVDGPEVAIFGRVPVNRDALGAVPGMRAR